MQSVNHFLPLTFISLLRSCFSQVRYRAEWSNEMAFQSILISPKMLTDHMPDAVLRALKSLCSDSSSPLCSSSSNNNLHNTVWDKETGLAPHVCAQKTTFVPISYLIQESFNYFLEPIVPAFLLLSWLHAWGLAFPRSNICFWLWRWWRTWHYEVFWFFFVFFTILVCKKNQNIFVDLHFLFFNYKECA